jgi:hypothetical protein
VVSSRRVATGRGAGFAVVRRREGGGRRDGAGREGDVMRWRSCVPGSGARLTVFQIRRPGEGGGGGERERERERVSTVG